MPSQSQELHCHVRGSQVRLTAVLYSLLDMNILIQEDQVYRHR